MHRNLYPATAPKIVNAPVVIVMVGLPARGKSYISRKLARYLNWIGVSTKVFSLGDYRRNMMEVSQFDHSFFDPNNPNGMLIREQCAERILNDVVKWLEGKKKVAIFDATNSSRKRRQHIVEHCAKHECKVMFIESVVDDPAIVRANVMAVKISSPDYAGVEPEQACEDFLARIEHYKQAYEPLCMAQDKHISYMKIINGGTNFVVNQLHGYLESRIAYYLMNIQITPKAIYLTRHGESAYNLKGRIGGDSDLSPRGYEYARKLSEFMKSQNLDDLKVWTSEYKRTIQTAENLQDLPQERWTALNEIDAGVCEGMTYEEIQEKYPEDFARRDEDKFHYRYSRGESYEDLVARLEPVIMELERQQNVLVICHQAVARCLLAYFLDKNYEQLPYIKVPLHSVLKLTSVGYGCQVEKFDLNIPAVNTHRSKPEDVSVTRDSQHALNTVPEHE
ncbi:6-phosphofructo-2-kinase/fructose-2,6-bisphosphatase 1 [Exaiptasia diaphana]|uniref:6-phosphofructo-2-kinase domain-containing protein n=1 Tax=Exaiptasia diaphana TaxID=2652724 RepID=A0A913XLY4_EXADI|nr:6-phosphofructo-2-kinase/fructose-2,6-bisphosphatase 1 [Exaiptasia diaphana]KXJ20233.1 6-phosphofructo-2-kinase/fructose-2,6-bisphosphatase 1 [Exaiptasia diaphana]